MLTLNLPNEVEEKLAALAKRTGQSKAFFAYEAILNYLEDMEDYYLAEKALEEINNGEEVAYTSAEVRTQLF